MTEYLPLILGAIAIVACTLGVKNYLDRQKLSLRGRIYHDAAKLLAKLPKGPSEDELIIARAVARQRADDDAKNEFKASVNQL